MAWKITHAPVEWVSQLEDCIRDIAALQPHVLVSNGDQTNGKERDWGLATSVLKRHCNFPVLFTMGNHEYYAYYEEPLFTPAFAQNLFLHYSGLESIYYEANIQGNKFICLSTEAYSPDLNDAGWMSEEQLNWLENRLAQAGASSVFVFFHQPINDTVADSRETCLQSEQLLQILKKKPGIFLFTGHTHARMDRPDQLVQRNDITFVGGGCLCNESPQSRWVDIYEDRIVLRIRDHTAKVWLDSYKFVFPL